VRAGEALATVGRGIAAAAVDDRVRSLGDEFDSHWSAVAVLRTSDQEAQDGGLLSLPWGEESEIGTKAVRARSRDRLAQLTARRLVLKQELLDAESEQTSGGGEVPERHGAVRRLRRAVETLDTELAYLTAREQAAGAIARRLTAKSLRGNAMLRVLEGLRGAAVRDIVPATLPPAVASRLSDLALTLSDVCVFDACSQRGTCETGVLHNSICYHGWAVFSIVLDIHEPRALWAAVSALRPCLPPWARGAEHDIAAFTPSAATATAAKWPPGQVHPLQQFTTRAAPQGEVDILAELPMPDGPAGFVGAGGGWLPARAAKEGGRRRADPARPTQAPIRVPHLRRPDPHCIFGSTDATSRFGSAVGGRKLSQRSARGVALASRELASATSAKAARLSHALAAVAPDRPDPNHDGGMEHPSPAAKRAKTQ
jgi:hypothetical protein